MIIIYTVSKLQQGRKTYEIHCLSSISTYFTVLLVSEVLRQCILFPPGYDQMQRLGGDIYTLGGQSLCREDENVMWRTQWEVSLHCIVEILVLGADLIWIAIFLSGVFLDLFPIRVMKAMH